MLLRLRSALLASLGLFVIALVCYWIRASATTAAILLLLGVLLAGTYARLSDAVVAAVTATACLDYFFVPPVGAITIADPQGWIVLAVFLVVSIVATRLSTLLRHQRDELVSRQAESEKLHALSRAMLLSSSTEEMGRLIVNKCIELFGFSEIVLFESATGTFYRSQTENSIAEERLRRVAVYGSVEQQAETKLVIVPITLGNKSFGSLGLRGVFLPEGTRQALGNTVAIGLAQAQAQDAGSQAEAVRKSEELKSVLIDALAHDLKTPLTAIEAASDMLLDDSGVPPEQRNELVEVIHEEAQGLKRLVGEAIHLARVDAKKLKLECRPVSVAELVHAAKHSLGERILAHEMTTTVAQDLPQVLADRELIVQALKQLLDNAAKYSPPRSVITVSAEETNGWISISVRDKGQGLTELEQSRVFDKFYRGRYDSSAIQGTGMGLAIAKEILEAHGGSLTVQSQVGQGSQFTMTLHAASRELQVEHQGA